MAFSKEFESGKRIILPEERYIDFVMSRAVIVEDSLESKFIGSLPDFPEIKVETSTQEESKLELLKMLAIEIFVSYKCSINLPVFDGIDDINPKDKQVFKE